jgi:serine/arginine repetitive matrix protein 1
MIRGTSHEQDSRFPDKCKKMLEKSTWPEEYDNRVNLQKVDFDLIKLWIDQKVRELFGY